MPLNLISIEDAAKLLGVHPVTLLRAVKAGELIAYQIGKGYRVSLEELETWVKSRQVTPQPEESKEVENGNPA